MKTLNQIDKEIQDIKRQMEDEKKIITSADRKKDKINFNLAKRKIKRLNEELQVIKTCKAYIETTPSEDYLKKELVRINNRLDLIERGAPEMPIGGKPNKEFKKIKDAYLREYRVPVLKKQLKTINYLLK